jgi:NADPH2:quinone reductase
MSEKNSIPSVMKAVFLEKEGGPLIVREVPTPVPAHGEVLIKMAASPINPSDLARIRNAHLEHDLSTYIPGLEGCGTVVSAGGGILPKIWMGKRVSCSAGSAMSGTWAEYMVTPAGKCFPLSKKVSDEQGSMSLVNPLTAIGFFEIAEKEKHRAIINNAAASALGRMVELLGKKHNIPVINIVRSTKQVEMLTSLGSKHILNSTDQDFIEKLGALSHELNATVLFDSVCSRQLEKMISVLPFGSSVIIYGNLTGEEQIMINPRNLIANDIKVSGFYLGNRTKVNGLFKNMMNLRKVSSLMSSELTIKIQARFPIEKIQEAIDCYLADMSAGKVILKMG